MPWQRPFELKMSFELRRHPVCRFRTTLSTETGNFIENSRKEKKQLKSPKNPLKKKKREKDEQQLVVVAQGEVDGVRRVVTRVETREFHKQLEKVLYTTRDLLGIRSSEGGIRRSSK